MSVFAIERCYAFSVEDYSSPACIAASNDWLQRFAPRPSRAGAEDARAVEVLQGAFRAGEALVHSLSCHSRSPFMTTVTGCAVSVSVGVGLGFEGADGDAEVIGVAGSEKSVWPVCADGDCLQPPPVKA